MSLLQLISQVAIMALALSAVMTAAWQIQRRTGATGWIDVCWTFGTGLVACVASLVPVPEAGVPTARQTMVALLVAIWSLRLGSHLLSRTWKAGDDPRYRDLIDQWGDTADRRMFLQLQAQAAVGLILTISVALAAHNPRPALGLADLLGAALLLTGLIGEALSDAQLSKFRSNPANRHRICEAGLWKWSRHPNYFFEWLCWLAYPLIAIDASYPPGWITLLAPASMYWILVHVSGVPPLEQHMLRSRGQQFRDVQARTRPFFPFPKRTSGS
ncbi:steroid 5-alpha reductase family enzyme [Bradyrhizobium sp. USDA 3240]